MKETWDMILKRALKKDVILVPGRAFMCDPTAPCSYMRAAFSIVTPEKMDKVGLLSLKDRNRTDDCCTELHCMKFI